MVLLATLQFLYVRKNSQEIIPSTWVVLQLYSPLYVTVVEGKMFPDLNSCNPTEEQYIENQQDDSSDLKQFHIQKAQKEKFYHVIF